MAWKLDSDRPIYAQLLEQIQMQIVSGRYPCGGKLPSVRELASEAGVNPNTMQKALQELERQGLIQTQRTSGRFVTEDTDRICHTRQELARELLAHFLHNMQQLGYEKKEILSFFESEHKEGV
ncbi:GntR family transcriptional regulator [Lachnospiraceae bacterium JLR.KK008]